MRMVDCRLRLLPVLAGLLALSAPAAAKEPSVTITGGLQPDGSYYRWEIENHSSSPVVSFEFPHYAADLFQAPKGWKSKSKFKDTPGTENDPWTCKAWVDSPQDGIPPGGKVSVTMRVVLLESRKGRGVVKVGLADGKMLEIAGVELPCGPSFFERFGLLITLLILIGLVALIAARRQHRGRAGLGVGGNRPVDSNLHQTSNSDRA
ncbi:MAG TPA: hypothetical protein VMV94_12125 [Phycisphaerae bacterium]|nr:hypothetical protein [Phycisphaerae bacterium]